MREISRIQFKFAQRPFVEFWNETNKPTIEYGVIAVYKDSEDYIKLSSAFKRYYASEEPTWKELIEIEYSQEDLLSSEILLVWVSGNAGKGGNFSAQVYEYSGICSTCGQAKNTHQVSDIVLNITQSDLNQNNNSVELESDLNRSDFDDEIIISDKLRRLLEKLHVNGMEFKPVYQIQEGRTDLLQNWNQLVVQNRIGDFVSPTKLARQDLCTECSEYRVMRFDTPRHYLVSEASEPYFESFQLPQYALMLSAQKLKVSSSQIGQRCLIVSRDLYIAFLQNGITGFWVQPAHFV